MAPIILEVQPYLLCMRLILRKSGIQEMIFDRGHGDKNTTLATISHKDVSRLLNKKPEYEKFVRMYLEQIHVDLAERGAEWLFNTAKERYDKLLDKNPEILQRKYLPHVPS